MEKVTENDGYMEPYEAQKMMAGKVESSVQGPLHSSISCCSVNLVATALFLAACAGTRSRRGGHQIRWMATEEHSCFAARFSQIYMCDRLATDRALVKAT